MAVVTRGSFDEGPIVLSLPPYYTYDLNELDPVFTAWDKSTGITISASQVTDFDTEVANNTAVALNTAKNSYPSADASKMALIPTPSSIVTYTGATGDIDLGTYDIAVGKVTINDAPVAPTDAATKAYVDSILTTGIIWDVAVIDIVSALPLAPTDGDRYILSTDNHINERTGGNWVSTHPTTGTTLYVEGNVDAPVNNTGLHTFNGTNWVYIGASIKHNDTTDIQGGSAGNRWHLDSTTYTNTGYVATSTADSVPTGLVVVADSIIMSLDGTQTAYAVLTWDAISSNTFDHYHVRYKKTANTYYTYLDSKTNNIIIEGLTPNTSYDFAVASVNRFGTDSDFCATVTVTTAMSDVPPATVSTISATGGIQYVILEWNHNAEVDIVSYNIYRNTINDTATAELIGNSSTNYFIDGNKTGGTTYYYWLKAVNTSGILSDLYSDTMSATPRNVSDTDIVTISGSKVLINGSVYLSNWQKTGDLTMIDGGSIATNTVTVNKLSFTPLVSTAGQSDIVATINASAEALQISGKYIEINGQTTFSTLGTNGKLRIFEDTNTAIRITDDGDNDVFKVEIGGTNVGDVTIGDWAGGQGIQYDKSIGITTFQGVIQALTGYIGAWTINSAALIKDTGSDFNSSGMSPNDYPFYAGATFAKRGDAPFKVSSGGVVTTAVLSITGLDDYTIPTTMTNGNITNSSITTSDSKISINSSRPLVIPRINGTPSNPEAGMIFFNTSTGHYYGYNGAGSWLMLG